MTLATTFFVSFGATQAQDSDEVVAVKAAMAWLATIDKADYSGSFEAMSSIFTNGVRENIWRERISEVRDPLGHVRSRALDGAESKSDIESAPPGEYMIIRFNTAFSEESRTTEAVTMYKQKDGSWRSAGYYVRKSQ